MPPAVPVRSLRQFLDGEFEALRADFNERMTEACPVTLLASVRSSLAREMGKFLELGSPCCHVPVRLHRRRHPHHLQEGSAKGPCRARPGRPHRRAFSCLGKAFCEHGEAVHDPRYQTDSYY